MYALELLVSEHENIERLNHVMRKACLAAMDGGDIDTEVVKQFITFVRIYADRNHHGKEEALLFKDMQEHLGSAAETLVKHGMLVEHDLGRLCIKQLEDAVAAYETDRSSSNKLDIIVNAGAYADLLRRHIERENLVVYPFAQRGLSAEVLERLDESTKEFEERTMDEREQQLAVLAELEKK